MAEKNIFGLPPREDELSAQIKSLEKQRENLDARLRAEGIDPDTLGGDFDNRNLIEKALNLTPDQGVLLDFFEILNRPVQAVKGAVTAGYDGKSALEGAWEGLSGQKKTTGRELLGAGEAIDFGSPLINLVADIGVDIGLDPLTYVPAGYFLKGLKGITRRTTNKVFQIGTINQTKLISQLQKMSKYGFQQGDDIKTLLEKAAKDGNSSAVFKFTKSDIGQYILDKAPQEKIAKFLKTPQGKTVQEAVEAGEYIVTGAGKKFAKREYGSLSKVIDYLEQRLSVIQKGTFQPRELMLTELQGVKKIQDIVKQFGDDYRIIATTTRDKLDDIIILKRYADTDYFTNIGSIEAKYLGGTSAQAYGKRINLTLARKSVDDVVDAVYFGSNSPLSGTEFEKSFLKSLNSLRTKDGRTLGNMLKAGVRSKKGFSFKKFIIQEDMLELKRIMYNWYKESGMDIIYARGKNGEGRFFKLDDVFDDLDLSKTELVVSKKEVYIKGGFNANLDDIYAKGNYLLADDIAKEFVQKQMQVSISFLDDLSTKGGFVGATARGLKKVGEAIGSALNATFNFSDFAKNTYKFITGETNLFVQRSSARLTSLTNEAVKKYGKESAVLIRELIESGAYIDDANRLQVISTEYHLDDFMEYVQGMLNGNMSDAIPLYKFNGRGTQSAINVKKTFLKRLNDLADSAGLDPMFEVVEKGDATVLKFKGSLDEFKAIKREASKSVARGAKSPYLKFGRRSVSTQAEALLRADPELFRKIQSFSDDILSTLAREGGFNDILTELIGKQGYVRHIMTKQAYEAASTSGVGAISRMAKRGTDLLSKRRFALGTVDELNAVFKEFYNMDFDFFNTNYFDTVQDLVKVTSRKVEQAKMLKLVLNQTDKYGKSLFRVVDNTKLVRDGLPGNEVLIKSFEDELPALFKNLSEGSKAELTTKLLKRKANIGDKAIVINKNALDLLKRAEKAYKDVPELIKFYDGFLNTWKGLTLITPGFHMRNLFGNMFNSYAVGMDLASQSQYGLIAMQELNEYARLVKKIADGGTLTSAEKKIYETVKLFEAQGLIQSHRGVRDLEYLKEATELATKGGPIKNTYNNAVRFNFNVAEKMDDVQRYILYRWSLDKTGDASRAARTVTESLFDYTHLTGFEKDVMKRVFPFYTFMKNNFIFQAKNIIRNPKLYARTGRAYKYYLEDLAGYGPENLPDYATENMWLPIPIQVKRDDKKAIAFLKANLPLSDFMEIVENPFKKGVVSIAAPIKLPIELGLGRDLFTGRRISAFPGERDVLAKDGGVFNFLRDERGNLTVTQMPIVQKIAAEIGLRTPLNFGSAGLDILDTLLGYQGPQEGLADFAARMGLAGVQDLDRLKLTELYQDLEKLREMKKYYEQETGYQLPLLPRG